jgi:hypothetical protein
VVGGGVEWVVEGDEAGVAVGGGADAVGALAWPDEWLPPIVAWPLAWVTFA